MNAKQISAVLNDRELMAEIARKTGLLPFPPRGAEEMAATFESLAPARADGATPVRVSDARERRFEAIVERFGRPSLLVRNGTFEVPPADTWKARLYPTKARLDLAIRSVGRLELVNHSLSYGGTAWLVAPDVIVTNRHVAQLFAQRRGGEFTFRRSPNNARYGARIDFREEYLQPTAFEVEVSDILYVAENDDEHPDVAFLHLRRGPGVALPPPIPLYGGEVRKGQTVAVVGYPAFDDRNNLADMARIFEGKFGVKRLAPGEIDKAPEGGVFTHDCTTLGGNSGSCVLDVATGAAVGLHFAGEYLLENYAVSAAVLREYLERHARPRGLVVVDEPGPAEEAEEEGPPTAEDLADREGYDSGFLGDTAHLTVPLPALSPEMEERAAVVAGAPDDASRYVLKYTHFSVVMNAARRFAYYTATNIDGAQSIRLDRGNDRWHFDPRIDRRAQVGNELYSYNHNPLDRGHLTRRLDPVWGSEEEAERANADTFFFTNCTPQYAEFNQGQHLWQGLENYLLDNADNRDFKATIFTGPVFSDEDHAYRFKLRNGQFDEALIPLQYWKVAVMVRRETNRLSATAYLVSQKDLLTNLEFVYGQHRTFQVAVRYIERLTGLDFGGLRDHDPLDREEAAPVRELTRLDEVAL
jgi:endonuclease G, mitochondrial